MNSSHHYNTNDTPFGSQARYPLTSNTYLARYDGLDDRQRHDPTSTEVQYLRGQVRVVPLQGPQQIEKNDCMSANAEYQSCEM